MGMDGCAERSFMWTQSSWPCTSTHQVAKSTTDASTTAPIRQQPGLQCHNVAASSGSPRPSSVTPSTSTRLPSSEPIALSAGPTVGSLAAAPSFPPPGAAVALGCASIRAFSYVTNSWCIKTSSSNSFLSLPSTILSITPFFSACGPPPLAAMAALRICRSDSSTSGGTCCSVMYRGRDATTCIARASARRWRSCWSSGEGSGGSRRRRTSEAVEPTVGRTSLCT
mmetsp:Transcript_8494/g.20910  ORF Transcript_8494/g.20910 Transcript_8494/m.20910 type:complete len:225 (+) Transcript_8494:218-892(+)